MRTADREALEAFCEESADRLNSIEESVERLAGSSPPDAELLHGIFRDTHSLKGGANLLGLGPVEQLCHKLEDILASIRDGSDVPDRALIEILGAGYGRIRALLENLHVLRLVDVRRDIENIDRRLAARVSREVRRTP